QHPCRPEYIAAWLARPERATGRNDVLGTTSDERAPAAVAGRASEPGRLVKPMKPNKIGQSHTADLISNPGGYRGHDSHLARACWMTEHGQGNRVKKSTPNETCQVVVVPRGDKAAGAHGILFAGRFL